MSVILMVVTVVLLTVGFPVGFALAGPSPFVPAMARKRGATGRADWLGVTAFIVAFAAFFVARWSTGPRCGLTDDFSAPC